MSTKVDPTYDALWNQVLQMVQDKVSGPTYSTWFEDTHIVRIDESEQTVYISAPSTFVRNWLSEHYTSLVETLMMTLMDREYRVRFITEDDVQAPAVIVRRAPEPVTAEEDTETNLNPRYTFDSFVIGAGNRFAHAACLAVAERPANAYNPLFIYGGVGLGKTHLMHAIGHYVRQHYPNFKVSYISSERFTNEFIAAIRDKNPDSFRARYRTVDVLTVQVGS